MALRDFSRIALCLIVGLPLALAGCSATENDMTVSLSMAPDASSLVASDGSVSLPDSVSVLPAASAAYAGEAETAVTPPADAAMVASEAEPVTAVEEAAPAKGDRVRAVPDETFAAAPEKPAEDEAEFKVAALAEEATAPVRSLGRTALAITGLDGSESPRTEVDRLIEKYAEVYDVPVSLVRRVVKRESNFRANAYNRGHWGLMQIKHATARGMGYKGPAKGLLDAETNLKYAVKYLRGAYLVADGNHDRADRLYQRGYYYDAKRKGLLDETGLGKDRRRRKA